MGPPVWERMMAYRDEGAGGGAAERDNRLGGGWGRPRSGATEERLRLGRHVRDLRVTAGMSQAALAKASGLDQSTVSRLERGTSTRPEEQSRILSALGTDIEALASHDLAHPDADWSQRLDRSRPGLGAAMKARREAMGLSQADVHRTLGLPAKSSVSDIEIGAPVPDAYVRRIAAYLNVDVDAFPAGPTGHPLAERAGARAAARDRDRVQVALAESGLLPDDGTPDASRDYAADLRTWVENEWCDAPPLCRSWHHDLFMSLAKAFKTSEGDMLAALASYWSGVDDLVRAHVATRLDDLGPGSPSPK